MIRRFWYFLCLVFAAGACADTPQSDRSLAAIERVEDGLKTDLEAAGLSYGAPVFIQITKIPADLKLFIRAAEGRFVPFRTYPICAYSGGIGPKTREGDGKSPEGFYTIRPSQMNPASSYHLSFNLGFPNAYDRAQGYTGSFLMVHGRCVSIGCYAMTDPAMDEIWALLSAAFDNGQKEIDVHIFPFPMTTPMRQIMTINENGAFWQSLAPAWTAFHQTQRPPKITVAGGQYRISPTVE